MKPGKNIWRRLLIRDIDAGKGVLALGEKHLESDSGVFPEGLGIRRATAEKLLRRGWATKAEDFDETLPKWCGGSFR